MIREKLSSELIKNMILLKALLLKNNLSNQANYVSSLLEYVIRSQAFCRTEDFRKAILNVQVSWRALESISSLSQVEMEKVSISWRNVASIASIIIEYIDFNHSNNRLVLMMLDVIIGRLRDSRLYNLSGQIVNLKSELLKSSIIDRESLDKLIKLPSSLNDEKSFIEWLINFISFVVKERNLQEQTLADEQ